MIRKAVLIAALLCVLFLGAVLSDSSSIGKRWVKASDGRWQFNDTNGQLWNLDDGANFNKARPNTNQKGGNGNGVDKDCNENDDFDFIIAGGGAASCVLARRLAEHPRRPSVLVLEKGRFISTEFSENLNPNGGHWDQPDEDKYQSIPQEFTGGFLTGGRMPHFTAFKGVAGGTNHYGATAMRPSEQYWNTRMPSAYNHTAMLLRLKQNEDHFCCYLPESVTGISAQNCSLYHGCGGPMPIAMQVSSAFSQPVRDMFDAAAAIFGEVKDHNNPKTRTGIAGEQNWFRLTNKSDPLSPRVKISTFQGWLPQSFRDSHPNLMISTFSTVTRLLYSRSDPTKITGVEYIKNGTVVKTVRANRLVFVSMGVIETPHFLQANGIGPADLIERIGGTLHVNNQLIGQKLSAHQGALIAFKYNTSTITFPGTPGAGGSTIIDLLIKSPFTTLGNDIQCTMGAGGYSETIDYDVAGLPNDMVIGVDGAISTGQFGEIFNRLAYTGCNIQMVDPTSVGSVNATSTNMLVRPVIDYGWTRNSIFSTSDFDKLMYGLAEVRRAILTPSQIAKYNVTEIFPGDTYKPHIQKYYGVTNPADIQYLADMRYFQNALTNMYHITGTVRLGEALDLNGNVIGAKGLAVCDNSVLPQPDGNPTTAMMAVCSEIASRQLALTYA